MSFLNNMMNQFTHQNQSQQGGGYPQQGGYGQQQYQQNYNDGRPHPPEPWIAEWDQGANRWYFVNRQTGERSWNFPQQGPGGSGYDNRGYGQQGGYGQQSNYAQQPAQKSHGGRNTAIGVAAGLAGGALLMHEGHKVEERWDEDKYRAEERFDDARYRADYDADRAEGYVDRKVYDGVQDVEDFPENAANWTGRKVQEVEDIPEDVANWTGRKVQEVEDIPEDIAYDVERPFERMDNAYDAGRDEQEYRDDRRDDDW